jgi:predicted nucleic acid-binding protein
VIVVSDSSPLVTLSAVGHLDLMRTLFTTVLIPDAVYREVVAHGEGRAGATEVHDASWIRRESAENISLVHALTLSLDVGEAEAIALALERDADLVLLDERRGRQQAERMGLTITGTLGILVEAKRQNLIAEVRPILDALRAEADFWIADALYQRILDLAGENF